MSRKIEEVPGHAELDERCAEPVERDAETSDSSAEVGVRNVKVDVSVAQATDSGLTIDPTVLERGQ